MDKDNDILRHEIANLNNSNKAEAKNNVENHRKIDDLEHQLREKKEQLNRCSFDLDNCYLKNDKLVEDNNRLFSEIERLKEHIAILSDQNKRVGKYLIPKFQMSDELEYVLDQDERIKSHLAKKDKIYELLNQNKFFLEKSINGLDEYLRKDFSPKRQSKR